MPARTFCLPWETLSFQYSHASFVCSIICSPGHEFLGCKTQDWEEWKKSCEPLDCVHCFKAWEYFSARQSRNRQLSFLRCASESNCFLLDLTGAPMLRQYCWPSGRPSHQSNLIGWWNEPASVWICDSSTLSVLVCFAAVLKRKMLSWDALASHHLPWQGVLRNCYLAGKASTRVLRATLMPNIRMGVVHVLTYDIVWHDPCYM